MLDTALNGARGAELGVTAAAFAGRGVAGPRAVLDGRWGVLQVMRGGSAAALTAALGERWEFADTKVKLFASCRFTLGPFAALHSARLDPMVISHDDIAYLSTHVHA